MQTYNETVLRFRVMRHDDLPEAHKEAYREKGINPDELWNLVYSFNDEADAIDTMKMEEGNSAPWETFKIVDGGEATVIKRSLI